ncbi:MAG: hypothetical protein JKY34_09250 [Kordiimonadaceae bacterium]|nr:hypothetical protein [Kordiimonadaceae bacterium]
MSYTLLADVIEPSVFIPYQNERIPYKLALSQESGVLVAPIEAIAKQLGGGGRTLDAPYWEDLARGEADIPDDTATEITPDKITSTVEKMTKHTLAKSWSASTVAGWVSTGVADDPMRNIADKMGDWWHYNTEQRLIKTLTGVLADNGANDSGDMIASVYDDIASPTAANKIGVQAVNEATLTAGDRMGDFRVICMHSHVYNTLRNDEQISFRRPSETPHEVPYYQGMMVIFSDTMPVTAGSNSSKYTCFLLGEGALSHSVDIPSEPTQNGVMGLEMDRNSLVGNGGGKDTIITRRHEFMHPRGVSWLDANRAKKMAATNAELALATNWDRKYDRKNIRIAALEVNA